MFERILVPLDGSTTAEKVLPQVRRILHHGEPEIILVRAVVPLPSENGMVAATDNLDTALAYLKTIEGKLSGTRVKSVARVGTAADVILTVVAEEHSTLIAMATHGHRGLKRLLLGSVAESVLRKSPIPVLAVRPFELQGENRPIRSILVPVEKGGKIGLAEDLARLCDARLILLRVLDDSPGKGVDLSRERIRAESELQRLEEDLDRRGMEAVSLLQTGSTVEEILHAIRIHGIDLVAMRTHARSGLARILKGSTTEQLLREAPVPLLIAPIPRKRRRTPTREESGAKHPGSTMVF